MINDKINTNHILFLWCFRNHHVYFDNFFSSVQLLLNLAKDGIYACGTLRSNRVGFPVDLIQHVQKGLTSRGDYITRQCKSAQSPNWVRNNKQSSRLAVSVWQDNRPVVVVATNCDPTQTTHVQRYQKDGTRSSVPCPSSIALYNKYMSGVDHNDQLRGYYSVRTKGKKCYKYIWWFLFDVALTNMYILAKQYSPLKITSVKQFRTSIARSIIGDYSSRKRRGRPLSSASPSYNFCLDHFPMRAEKRGRCYYCYHIKKRRHDTAWSCMTCTKYLCFDGHPRDCFILYHNTHWTSTCTINNILYT